MEFTRQKLCKDYSAVTAMMGMHLNISHNDNPLQKLWSNRPRDNRIERNAKDKSSCSPQYHVLFLKFGENQYSAKRRCLPVSKADIILSNYHFPSTPASVSGQGSSDPHDLSSDDADTSHPNIWLKQHQNEAITQLAYQLPQSWIWIHQQNYQKTRCCMIRRIMITNPTQWGLARHYGYRISASGGDNQRWHIESVPISVMCHGTNSLSYQMVSGGKLVFPLGEM
jgi:hypothetical protein